MVLVAQCKGEVLGLLGPFLASWVIARLQLEVSRLFL